MEKISIIVPIYNVDEYLSRCIDSLLNQTYQNIEIILVDDCSKDNSALIAKDYAEKNDDKCVFVQREKNGGLAAARNSGIAVCHGSWISFVDSDDWVSPDYIETLYNAAIEKNAEIVMSNFYYAYQTGVTIEVSTFGNINETSTHHEIVAFSDPSSCTRLYSARFFKECNIRFPEDIWRCEDIPTIIPIITKTDKIAFVNKAMYYYFQRSASLSNSNYKNVDVSFYPKVVTRMLELSEAGFEAEMEYRSICELLYGMPMIMMRSGRNKKELKAHIEAFEKRFPDWRNNKYLSYLPLAKRIFIKYAANSNRLLLKLMIFAWDITRSLFNRQKG